jgi:ABC-type sugar transport system ATPase subunit
MTRDETTDARPLPDAPPARMSVRGLTAGFGGKEILHGVDLDLPTNRVTASIGPSGCGKSTFIRNLNRLHEGVRGAWVKGTILLDGVDVNAPDVDPVLLRRRVGMVFQKPAPFPTMSIRDHVLAGLRLTGTRRPGAELDPIGRALQRPRPHRHVAGRGAHRGAVGSAHHRHRDPLDAAGPARERPGRALPVGGPHRGGACGRVLRRSTGRADRRLRAGALRVAAVSARPATAR